MSEQGGDSIASALAELIALLLSVENLEQALHHLAEMAVAVVPDGPSCGITVIRNGQATTAVYAGSIPKPVHDDQYQRGDGPCLEAARTGKWSSSKTWPPRSGGTGSPWRRWSAARAGFMPIRSRSAPM